MTGLLAKRSDKRTRRFMYRCRLLSCLWCNQWCRKNIRTHHICRSCCHCRLHTQASRLRDKNVHYWRVNDMLGKGLRRQRQRCDNPRTGGFEGWLARGNNDRNWRRVSSFSAGQIL